MQLTAGGRRTFALGVTLSWRSFFCGTQPCCVLEVESEYFNRAILPSGGFPAVKSLRLSCNPITELLLAACPAVETVHVSVSPNAGQPDSSWRGLEAAVGMGEQRPERIQMTIRLRAWHDVWVLAGMTAAAVRAFQSLTIQSYRPVQHKATIHDQPPNLRIQDATLRRLEADGAVLLL